MEKKKILPRETDKMHEKDGIYEVRVGLGSEIFIACTCIFVIFLFRGHVDSSKGQ
jgi:hypothetical protein